MADTYLQGMRYPVFRRRESHPGFCAKLKNLTGDAKRKGTSGVREAENTDAPVTGGLLRSSVEGGQLPWIEGAGHPVWGRSGSNGKTEEHADPDGRRQLSTGGTVWICERLGVQLPRPTRRQCRHASRRGISWPDSLRTMGGHLLSGCLIPWHRPTGKRDPPGV
jgi:hypothetical protein